MVPQRHPSFKECDTHDDARLSFYNREHRGIFLHKLTHAMVEPYHASYGMEMPWNDHDGGSEKLTFCLQPPEESEE